MNFIHILLLYIGWFIALTGGGIIFYRIRALITHSGVESIIDRVDHVLIVAAFTAIGLMFTPLSKEYLKWRKER